MGFHDYVTVKEDFNKFVVFVLLMGLNTLIQPLIDGLGNLHLVRLVQRVRKRGLKRLPPLDGDYGVPYISDHYPIEIVVRLK